MKLENGKGKLEILTQSVPTGGGLEAVKYLQMAFKKTSLCGRQQSQSCSRVQFSSSHTS